MARLCMYEFKITNLNIIFENFLKTPLIALNQKERKKKE